MDNKPKKNRPVAGWISVGIGIMLSVILILDIVMGFDTEASDYFAMGIFIVMLLAVGIPLLLKYIKGFGWAMGAIFCVGEGIFCLLYNVDLGVEYPIAVCVLFELLAVLFAWLFIRANLKKEKNQQ